jgi:AcrR family transcriptional regulator
VTTVSRVQRRMLATRERLLNSALALFVRQGVYETTVEDITDAADVGKGTFYEHFPSKTAIIRHLLRAGFEDLLNRCREEVGLATTAKNRVRQLLWTQFQFFQERRDLLIFFHQVRGMLKLQADDARPLQSEYKRYVRFLADQLGMSLDRRRYSPATLEQIACTMAGLVTGHLSYLLITEPDDDPLRGVTIPCRIFLEGIKADDWHD